MSAKAVDSSFTTNRRLLVTAETSTPGSRPSYSHPGWKSALSGGCRASVVAISNLKRRALSTPLACQSDRATKNRRCFVYSTITILHREKVIDHWKFIMHDKINALGPRINNAVLLECL